MNTTLAPIDATARPSIAGIYALEAWYEFIRTLRTPAFALPTLPPPAFDPGDGCRCRQASRPQSG